MKILPRQEPLARSHNGGSPDSGSSRWVRGDHPIRVTHVDVRGHTLAAGRSEHSGQQSLSGVSNPLATDPVARAGATVTA
jgi:hypothetical protein